MSPQPRGAAPAGAGQSGRALAGHWRLFAYRWLLGLAAAVFASDQASKAWIVHRLPYPSYGSGSIPVIPGFFYIVHVGNTGAAWSLFTGRSVLLALLAAGTLAAIFLWRRSLGLRELRVQIPFGLLCGGIAGNLADRLARGHVVDFIDLHFGHANLFGILRDGVYPTFNIADSAICVGVALYLLQSLRSPKS